MCGGPELLAIAALAKGTEFVSNRNANASLARQTNSIINESRQRDARLKAERALQEQQQKELQAVADKNISETTQKFDKDTQEQKLADAVAQRQQAFDEATAGGYTASDVPTSSSAPIIVKDAIARKLADAFVKSKTNNALRARLGGFDALNFNNNIDLSRNAEKLNEAGLVSDSLNRVAGGIDRQRETESNIAQTLMEIMRQRNANSGQRQLAGAAGTVGNAALIAGTTPYFTKIFTPTEVVRPAPGFIGPGQRQNLFQRIS